MDFIFGLDPAKRVRYDIETYPDCFTATFRQGDLKWVFYYHALGENIQDLILFMNVCRTQGIEWEGFNNLHFDYPVMHFIYRNEGAIRLAGPEMIYAKAQEIIDTPYENRFAHVVWENDQIVKQVDLFKVHHFDNVSKATSLKIIEFNLGMDSVEDLPFPPGSIIGADASRIQTVLDYNDHDVIATCEFSDHSESQLHLRERLSARYGESMMNYSDVKIGERILVRALEERGVECYEVVNGKRVKKQTRRTSINLADVIFPYIKFERPEFENIRSILASKTIHHTKAVFEDLIANVNGLEYKFGTGGLHASISNAIVHTTDDMQIEDVDVASYYPNISIKNRLFPDHLGEPFCDGYEGIYHERKTYPKGTPDNEAFKLALNGSYGGSNNEYSPFLDAFYTMATTINGQLMLCMLIEQLLKIPGLQMIQANTDGVTYLCPRVYLDHAHAIKAWWEQVTQLTLEAVPYRRMWIRDVNSYIAEKDDGSLKRIGAYAYVTALENPGTRELPWHKDWSMRVVAKAAEAYLVKGVDLRTFITGHTELNDFMLRTKVPRSSKLMWGDDEVQRTCRYYVGRDGRSLNKVMPPNGPLGEYKRANGVPSHYYSEVICEIGPGVWDERIHTKNKSTYEMRVTGVQAGWLVQLANVLHSRDVEDYYINYDFYIAEAEKLVMSLREWK